MTDEEILATADACGMMLFGLGLDKATFEFCILAFAKQIAKLERYHEREAIERHEANVQKFLGAPQPEQPPVAWVVYSSAENDIVWADKGKLLKQNTPLYTTPPQRTWVGLTGEMLLKAAQSSLAPEQYDHFEAMSKHQPDIYDRLAYAIRVQDE